MKIDTEKVDDVVLALLQLTAHSDEESVRAWKGQSWEVMDRLYQKGFIQNPKGKAKSVLFTEEGLLRSEYLFEAIFTQESASPDKKKNTTDGIKVRISLQGSDPEIWREICIPNSLCLGELHHLIQVVMGWENYHLHQFLHKKKVYGVPSPDDWQEVINEDDVLISDIFLRKGSRLEYEYDFGDSWFHDIVSMGKMKKDNVLFEVTDGAMACPPEDCGGIWGYQHLLEVLADNTHPEHTDMTEWVGREFDPTSFDQDEINQDLNIILK